MENGGSLLGRSDTVLSSSKITNPNIPKPDSSLLMNLSKELVVVKTAVTATKLLTRFYQFPVVVQGNLHSGQEPPLPMILPWWQRAGFFFISFTLPSSLTLPSLPWHYYLTSVPKPLASNMSLCFTSGVNHILTFAVWIFIFHLTRLYPQGD